MGWGKPVAPERGFYSVVGPQNQPSRPFMKTIRRRLRRRDLNAGFHLEYYSAEAARNHAKPHQSTGQPDLPKMDAENLTKQFTRFLVPGLAFLVFAVMLPTTALGKDLFFGKDPAIGASQAILLSVVAGYVMDSIRGYRWTLSIRSYNSERVALLQALEKVIGEGSPNPDDLVAILWKKEEGTYNRIFVERAEWVMILETAFAMWLSAAALFVGGFYQHFAGNTPSWQLWPLPLALLGTSYLASKNGIERMRAHNLKLIEAVRSLKIRKQ